MFTSEDDRVRIQLQLLTNFLIVRGQLRVLGDLWMQVGILTENSASKSDLNWSHGYITVSLIVTVPSYDVHLAC